MMKRYALILAAMLALQAQAATTYTYIVLPTTRHASTVTMFRKSNPCPVTGKTTGACPGWVVDHGMPLCAGGADAPYNMFWQKTANSYLKDADERRLCALLKVKNPS